MTGSEVVKSVLVYFKQTKKKERKKEILSLGRKCSDKNGPGEPVDVQEGRTGADKEAEAEHGWAEKKTKKCVYIIVLDDTLAVLFCRAVVFGFMNIVHVKRDVI